MPAIIVTPSSPTCDRDFRIAFIAPDTPTKEESVAERVFARLQEGVGAVAPKPQLKTRTLLLLFIPIFIIFCHFLAHRLSAHHPRLHFDVHTQSGIMAATDGSANGHGAGWFDMNDYWDARHARNFVIEEKHSETSL